MVIVVCEFEINIPKPIVEFIWYDNANHFNFQNLFISLTINKYY